MSSLAAAAPLLSLQPLRIKFPILLSSQRLSLLNLGILLSTVSVRFHPSPPQLTSHRPAGVVFLKVILDVLQDLVLQMEGSL